ncbi:MAG: hypothetical protein KGZ33_02730 [Alkaliphilus sp.]|nr:hypothetical protein [Alkaliphilus sp.]
MSILYDVLGIEKDAHYGSVKKYFSIVRKYPSERYPEINELMSVIIVSI